MSASPPDGPPTMPTMVSRLPKFGFRTKTAPPVDGSHTGTANGAGARLANGFYHQPGPPTLAGSYTHPPPNTATTTAATTTTKQNGFLKEPVSISMKWKSGGEALEREKELSGGKQVHQQPQGAPAASPCDSKKPAARGRGFGFPPTSLPSPPPQSDRRPLPVSKAGSHGPKSGQSVSALPSGRKPAPTGIKPCSGSSGSLRRPQSFTRLSSPGPGSSPGSRSGSPLSRKPPASRCHSSEALGSTPAVQLAESDRLRSRSFTHARQQALPTPALNPTPPSSLRRPAHPSYSFNRREVKDAAPRGTPAKPTGSGQPADPGSKGLKPQSSAPPGRTAGAAPATSPLSSLKKPLLPSVGSASKHSGISYKLSRPSLNKQSRPLRATPTNEQRPGQGRTEQRSATKHSPERPPQPPGEGVLTAETASRCEVSIAGETLEDMSLSSSSSLDKNDSSQEYMDDFDNLGNGGLNLLLLSSKNEEDDSGLDQSCARFDDDVSVNGVIKPTPTGLCFLDAGVEWNGVRLNGERRERRLSQHQRRSSQLDYHEQGGSSLDLSPSDSCGSGGTYMWDEEGLEPLRGNATTTNSNTTHHIGSFDSDLNSIDLLNNLESCDLDDDDLMLDVDVSEDASLHSDGDAISHMAQWRRRQLCWGMQELHDNSDHQGYKLDNAGKKAMTVRMDANLILDLCPSRSPQLSPGSPGLGMDVEELAEDCCEVRSQLEHLQRLLLQEEDVDEDTLTTDTLSPDASHSSNSCSTQVEALLQEVQQLREELRSRDHTILQLNRQLTDAAAATTCRCLETKTGTTDRPTQTSWVGSESVASQTPWKEQATFPPAPFLSPRWQYQRSRPYRGRPKPGIPPHLARKITDSSLLQLRPPGLTDTPSTSYGPAPCRAPPLPAPAPAPAPASPLH
ncbi:uncharacterized protein ccser2b isoform X2 [Nelusetta ayraudi]|uniref:uncharacterized protein ccser2b isoform X2 n=1 Tax=Nelusetta ayraudi TaxID=303726 RepID=UPI003F6F1749